MYDGQGRYISQFGQGSYTPMPPPYQQRLPAPPPLPPHFQRGPPGPPSSITQTGPAIYPHASPAPPSAVRQAPPSSMPNTSQPYPQPQPLVHGSNLYMHPLSQLGSQNVHHMPPTLPPPPPRVLPPPPPPPATYRATVQQQSQQPGGIQGLQHIPPPPLPPTSSFIPSSSYGSVLQSNSENSHIALRPFGINSSMQPDHSVVAAGSYSPTDSDMEMEDDITRSDDDQGVNPANEGTNSGYSLVCNDLDVNGQLQHVSSKSGWYPAENITSKLSFSLTPVMVEQASAAGEHNTSDKNSQLLKGGSPFRLLQEYASDESSKDNDVVCLENVTPSKGLSSVAARATSLQKDTECTSKPVTVSKSLSKIGLSMSPKARDVSQDSVTGVMETATGSVASEATDDNVDDKGPSSISHVASPQAFQKKDDLECGYPDASLNGKFEKLEEKSSKSASDSPKVDKFGRLVREGASDSDSDDPRHNERQSKRGRSWSRSPLARRRRSPRKRRDKRSKSRSWSPRRRRSRSRSPKSQRSRSRSPRKRRSRSRSPAFRHISEFTGESSRRDRGQIPDCFDFRRGRCYRGASCRYLHHESGKIDGSRRHRSKNQYSKVQPITKNTNIHEEIKNNLQNASDMPGSSSSAKEDGNVYQKRENSVSNVSQCGSLHQVGQLVDSYKISSESSREATDRRLETHVPQEEIKVPASLACSQTILRQQTAGLQTHSQVSDLQQRSYPPMQDLNRTLLHGEDLRFRPPPLYSSSSQQFVGTSLLQEDNLAQRPMLGLNAPSSFAQGHNQSLPTPFSREVPANKMQQSSGANLPLGELLKSSSQVNPYPQQQQPPYGLQHPVAISSSFRCPPDLQETDQSSHPPDFRESRNLTHYNPYASAFEQPLGSAFASDVFRQEKDAPHCSNYTAPFNLSHTQVDGQEIGSAGLRQAASSPNSAKAVGHNFPVSGGDQYDPLFDSIEPSSKLSRKFKNSTWEPSSESDIMLRHSGSNKPLDVEENKKREVGGVVLETSVDKEECGETADAEVGTVENDSPSNPIDDTANVHPDEIEIDQLKSPGKSKKSKESRSMKLFKVAVAEFVKEVLKPSWRQGNMSKEAFKTIVKKTVDKVSGAMKSHQIPKSRSKIDQYIDSSQRKLTKLVTGYVDKYVRM